MIYERIQIIISTCVSFFVLNQSTPLVDIDQNSKRTVDANVEESRIGIIISPMMTRTMIREIAIYWKIMDFQKGWDTLTLTEQLPGRKGKVLYTLKPRKFSGIRYTRVSSDFVPTSELTFKDRCLKYYITWHRGNVIQKVNCLATHPNWMSQRSATLGSKRLNEIFIPGTHDSGSYAKLKNSTVETLVQKYVFTQDEDILSQLIYGVRYLDIRVGRQYGSKIVWWVNHGLFSVHLLRTVIDDVKTFLSNTQEIVIFDVHAFPIGFGITPERAHEELVSYLKEQFAGYFLPQTTKNWAMSLKEIWATGKRLIIGYNNKDVYSRHRSTWQAVSHKWPNVQTLDELYTKIEDYEIVKKRYSRSPPTSVMAALTPTKFDVILNRLGGVRKMAKTTNMNITESYNEKWRCSANIVSMDYIKSSGIIEAALEWNDRRPSIC